MNNTALNAVTHTPVNKVKEIANRVLVSSPVLNSLKVKVELVIEYPKLNQPLDTI